LGADYRGLFFLAGFVDDEGGALGFLLGYLFGFYGGCEFGGEGEVLGGGLVRVCWEDDWGEVAYAQRDVVEHDVES
jgi:hypothetical protein